MNSIPQLKKVFNSAETGLFVFVHMFHLNINKLIIQFTVLIYLGYSAQNNRNSVNMS